MKKKVELVFINNQPYLTYKGIISEDDEFYIKENKLYEIPADIDGLQDDKSAKKIMAFPNEIDLNDKIKNETQSGKTKYFIEVTSDFQGDHNGECLNCDNFKVGCTCIKPVLKNGKVVFV